MNVLRGRGVKWFRRIGLLALLGISIGFGGAVRAENKSDSPSQKSPATQVTTHTNPAPQLNLQLAPLGRENRALTSFGTVIKKVAPSVVTVFSTKTVKDTSKHPLFNDPFFRKFFGHEKDQEGEDENEDDDAAPAKPRQKQEQSLGSGVIFTSDGYILSNSHVVDGAQEIKVSLADGTTEYTAKVVGVDPATDISVLKIPATNLTAIPITDSGSVSVGDVVLAIGNPFGVGQTVTMGIVSAIGRGGFGITDYEDFIQTDASINPGNSGGALVDVEGRLVGIPTAILSRTGGNVGIGFAVPVNMARTVMDTIVREGKVVRGYLGVFVQPISPELKKAFDLHDQGGALISGVAPKSPAADSGVKEGDVITTINGKPVSDSRHLRLMIAQNRPNSKITLGLVRDGQAKTVGTVLGELPAEEVAAKAPEPPTPTGRIKTEGEIGLQVRNLDPALQQELKLPSETKGGVLVEGVQRNSPAYEGGLRPGDVILEVNRKPVHNAQEVVNLSKPAKGQILYRVWSKGGSRFVVVEVGKEK
jgi:serine protease Do